MGPRTKEQTARNAVGKKTNAPGMCLQWSRERARIGPKWPDAATAWKNTERRHRGDRNPPRGAFVFWTGGSKGYGHVAVALGNGRIRSTDAGGAGKVATRRLKWVEQTWGMPYAGWADNVNGVTLKPPTQGEKIKALEKTVRRLRARVRELEGKRR